MISGAGARWRALSPNLEGALWVLAAAASYTAMSVLVKYLGRDYPALLQAFYRQVGGCAVLAPLILKRGLASFASPRAPALVFRASTAMGGNFLSFYAFQNMPLADANALSFTRTLWVVLLATLFMGERAGPLRIGATLVGFGGVLLMLAPQMSGRFEFGLPALSMLGSSLLLALSIVGMKSISRDHGPATMMVWSAGVGLLLSIPGAFLTWRWPTPVDFLLLSFMGVLAMATLAFYAKGVEVGDAAALAPVDYSRLVLAAAAGFVLFHETPGPWTIAGALVVVASTLFLTWREHRTHRRAAAPAA